MSKLYIKDGRTYEITEEQYWKLVIWRFLQPADKLIPLKGVTKYFTIRDIVTDADEIMLRNQSSLFDLRGFPQVAKKIKRKSGELS